MNKCKLSSRLSCTISDTHAINVLGKMKKHLPAVKVHPSSMFSHHRTNSLQGGALHRITLCLPSWTCHTMPVSFHIGLHSENTLHARNALHLTCRKSSYFKYNWVYHDHRHACTRSHTHTLPTEGNYIYILYLCIYIYLYYIYLFIWNLNPDISKNRVKYNSSVCVYTPKYIINFTW